MLFLPLISLESSQGRVKHPSYGWATPYLGALSSATIFTDFRKEGTLFQAKQLPPGLSALSLELLFELGQTNMKDIPIPS